MSRETHLEQSAPIDTGPGDSSELTPSNQLRMRRDALVGAILTSTVLITVFDFWSSAELIGSILFTFPLALCAMQSSIRLLWGIATAAVVVSIAANFIGFDRAEIAVSLTDSVNRCLLVGSLLTLTTFIHRGIGRTQQDLRDQAQERRQSAKRRLIEEALRVSDERYRLLLDGIKDYAIFMIDLQGRVISWNAGAERIKGYTEREIIGQSFACFFLPEDVEMDRPRKILDSTAVNGRYEERGMRRRKDGSSFLASITITALRDAAGNLRGYSELSHDLSDSVASEARYRGLLEAAPDAMVVVDEDEKIVLLNLRAESQFGYPRDELVGQPLQNIIPAGFAERLHADGLRTAADALAQQIGTGIELSGRRKDGGRFPIEIMLSPLKNAEGILVTAAIRDITERRKSEENLVKKVEELKRSNDELEHFAYIASHDLQEPLRMVASYTQLLAKRYKGRLDSEADEFIAFAVDGSNRMQVLIQDLLAYSRSGSSGSTLRETNSGGALRAALANLQATIDLSGAVVTCDSLPDITTDHTQLSQVFQNLVGNAIKYRGAAVPHIHIGAARITGGDHWIFSVRDNGMGIEPQYFDRIFVLFQRLHGREEFEGTGIGLAICKKIVERLGGRIWVESQPGKGSTFRFELPLRSDPVPAGLAR
jgi:PAS domain S-box-containing protein